MPTPTQQRDNCELTMSGRRPSLCNHPHNSICEGAIWGNWLLPWTTRWEWENAYGISCLRGFSCQAETGAKQSCVPCQLAVQFISNIILWNSPSCFLEKFVLWLAKNHLKVSHCLAAMSPWSRARKLPIFAIIFLPRKSGVKRPKNCGNNGQSKQHGRESWPSPFSSLKSGCWIFAAVGTFVHAKLAVN